MPHGFLDLMPLWGWLVLMLGMLLAEYLLRTFLIALAEVVE